MKLGLKMNQSKTKIMYNDKVTPNDIKIDEKRSRRIHILRTVNKTLKKTMTVK